MGARFLMGARETDRLPAFKYQWGRAGKALLEVVKDTSRSDKVAEMVFSLEGDGLERAFQRFRRTARGQKLLREKPSLLEYLTGNRTRLLRLPKNTFGYAYARYMEEERLDGYGLAEATSSSYREDDPQLKVDADRQWFRDRFRDNHDLWHPLAGYGADELGEAALLAFTYGQSPIFGVAVLAGVACGFAPLALPNDRWGFQPYMLAAWERGRRAKWLLAEPLEEMLELPLDDVRRRLHIEPPSKAHRGGLYAWSRHWPEVKRSPDMMFLMDRRDT